MVDQGNLPVFDHTDQGIRLLEEERRRIARDLHDGPAQAITNVSMRLEVIQRMLKSNPQMAEAELTRLNSRVVTIVNDIRRLIYDLRPVAIDEVGLVKGIGELCDRCQRDWKLSFTLSVQPDVQIQLAPAKQVAVYRLVQEIFNNIRKHAQANEVTVRIHQQGDQLYIAVADDGVGFNPQHIPTGHYGILGMKERAEYLNGSLDIVSEPDQGSQFIIAVPVSDTL